MPILHSPGVITPGQFGPDQHAARDGPCRNAFAFTMSSTGMPSVMATITRIPASAASMIASAAKGGGTKIIVASAPVACHRLRTVSKIGSPLASLVPALARRHAPDHFRAVFQALLGMKRAGRAGDALADDLRVLD